MQEWAAHKSPLQIHNQLIITALSRHGRNKSRVNANKKLFFSYMSFNLNFGLPEKNEFYSIIMKEKWRMNEDKKFQLNSISL